MEKKLISNIVSAAADNEFPGIVQFLEQSLLESYLNKNYMLQASSILIEIAEKKMKKIFCLMTQDNRIFFFGNVTQTNQQFLKHWPE